MSLEIAGRWRIRHFLATGLTVLALAVCGPVCERSIGQSAAPAKVQSDAPKGMDYVPYELLFRRIGEMDALADRLDAQGKTAAAASQRMQIPRVIGLNGQQAAMLRHIAAENNAELKENAEKTKAAKLKADEVDGKSAKHEADSPEVADLRKDAEEIVRDHMGQLQTGLGDQACQKIDAYVKRYAKPSRKKAGLSGPRKPGNQFSDEESWPR